MPTILGSGSKEENKLLVYLHCEAKDKNKIYQMSVTIDINEEK